MNADWRIERVGDICTFDKVQGIHTNLPYVGLENIESGTGKFEGSIDPVSVKSATFRFTKSHVLYGRLRPYLNKVLLPDFDGHCSTEIFPIKPGEGVSRAYLSHWLSKDTTVKAIDATCTGARMPRANMNAVLDFRLPVPPLDEQQRIVAILDEAFEGIATAKANAEKNLQNARELFDGFLQTIFETQHEGWETKAVSEWVAEGVLAKPQDGNHGEIHPTKADYVEVGVPFVMAADLTDGAVDTVGCRFITEIQATALRIGFAKPGDVLLSHKGTIGRVAILETGDDFVVLTPQVTYYRPLKLDRICKEFLYFCLMSPGFQSQMSEIAGAGSTRAYIGITKQLDLEITLPPLDVQHTLASRLRKVQEATARLADAQERKLAALDELKKSLLHQAFSGQLTSSKQAQQSALQTTTPEFSANVISLAYARHERLKRERTFGHVKEQKLLHLVESIAGINLGRRPMRDAAGPNDFQHMLRAEEWARVNGFFDMVKTGEGYEFKKLSRFDEHMSRGRESLAPYLTELERVIDLLVPMDTEEAEVFTTVHAAWNNMLIDGVQATDNLIVSAARENWHADKLRISEHRFRRAIELIRQKKLEPDGSAKYVGGQRSLL